MSAVVKHKLLLYAHDSAILVAGQNIAQVESLLSRELETVSEWLIGNKLSLHIGKTESILFGSKPYIEIIVKHDYIMPHYIFQFNIV